METAPKIDPIGTIRRNGLFQKKPFIFNLPFIKHKNWINKTSLFLSFSTPKISLSAAKKVKCFLGLMLLLKYSTFGEVYFCRKNVKTISALHVCKLPQVSPYPSPLTKPKHSHTHKISNYKKIKFLYSPPKKMQNERKCM